MYIRERCWEAVGESAPPVVGAPMITRDPGSTGSGRLPWVRSVSSVASPVPAATARHAKRVEPHGLCVATVVFVRSMDTSSV